MPADIPKKVLLIIDDDVLFCDAIKEYFSRTMTVLTAHTAAEGLSACSDDRPDVVLLDQKLPDAEGHTLCPSILQCNEQAKIIFITAHPSFEGAVKALRGGAYDYLSKPVEPEELSMAVKNALRTLSLENIALVGDYKSHKESEDAVLVGRSEAISEILKTIDLAVSADAPVLITGETGTGKNIVAKAIHYRSAARKDAFICINCAALPENLVEAELFGYEKGAFTGAVASRRGIFEMAEGGTLFLDEIGDMPMHLQTKLLGALEDKKIKRLGGDSIRPVNVRVIAATSTDLENVLGKTFRNDLYYRLSVIRIHIPPLCERRDDIPDLCAHLLRKISKGAEVKLADNELARLMEYNWPGNVRELKNVLERAFILQRGPVIRPSELLGCAPGHRPSFQVRTDEEHVPSLEELEKNHIRSVLERLSGNYTRTARALGISLSTLKRKIAEYDLK